MSKSANCTTYIGNQVVAPTTAAIQQPFKLGSATQVPIFSGPAPTTLLTTTPQTLTTAQMLSGVLTITPAAATVLNTPTAAIALANIKGVLSTNDFFDFSVINLSSTSGNTVTVTGGTGVTVIGAAVVAISSTGRFRLLFTSTVTGSVAANLYRLD